jgi:hypothetical protein
VRLKSGITTLLLTAFGSSFAVADVDPSFTVTFTGTGYVPRNANFIYNQTYDSLQFFLNAADGSPLFACPYDGCYAAPPGYYPCLAGLSGLVADLDYLLGSCSPTPPNSGTWSLFIQNDYAADGISLVGIQIGNFEASTDEPVDPMSLPDVNATGAWSITSETPSVPEPTSLILFLTALLVIAFVARRRIARGL